MVASVNRRVPGRSTRPPRLRQFRSGNTTTISRRTWRPDYFTTRLPTELLQQILAYLEKPDVQSARLACSAFSKLGLETLFRDVKIVHQRTSFERLLAISREPYLSRHVRTLHYQADIFWPVDYEDDVFEDWGYCHSYPRDYWRIDRDLKALRSLCKDQRRIRRQAFDVLCLSRLFKHCTRLDEVQIVFGADDNQSKTRGFPHSAFAKQVPGIMFDPSFTVQEERGRALQILANAVQKSGRQLRKLHIHGPKVDYYQDDFCMEHVGMNEVRGFLEHLPELEVHLTDFEEVDDVLDTAGRATVHDFMRHASRSVRILNLQAPAKSEPYGSAIDLEELIDVDVDWPNLCRLVIGFAAVEQQFADFLVKRLPVLEQLTLTQLHLNAGAWSTFFESVGGRFGTLQTVRLQGFFSTEDYYSNEDEEIKEIEIDFDDPSLKDIKNGLEKSFIDGCVCPDLEPARRPLSSASTDLPERLDEGSDDDLYGPGDSSLLDDHAAPLGQIDTEDDDDDPFDWTDTDTDTESSEAVDREDESDLSDSEMSDSDE